MLQSENRRKHIRISLNNPIPGFLELKSVERNFKKLVLTSILDISAGGMKIKSPYYLPLNINPLFYAYFRFDSVEFGFESRLVWHQVEKGESLYGFEFLGKSPSIERKLIETVVNYRAKSERLTP